MPPPLRAPVPWTGLIEAALRVIPAALALAGGFFLLGYGSRGLRTSARYAREEEAYFESIGRDGGS